MKSTKQFFVFAFLIPALFSCVNTKKAIYFDINQDAVTKIPAYNNQAIIQKSDLLAIMVTSLNAEASAIYNIPDAVVAGNGANSIPAGYLVNEQGNIQFPVIGSVKAEGLTKEALQEKITATLNERKLLLNPIVSIRIVNYRVTVLGEVGRPTVINVPSEKINILEAIGYAGDLSLLADRSNVLIIRDENNQRTFKIINLNANDIFTSPYYYLKPNDVVYVKPTKARVYSAASSASTTRIWLPVVFSAASLAVIIIDRIMN